MKIKNILFALLMASPVSSFAQDINDDEEVIEITEDTSDDNNSRQTATTVTDGGDDFVMPEGLVDVVDSLLNLYNSQEYLRQNPDCNLPDFNPTYEPEVYQKRLSKLPTIMEMPYNHVVQELIDRYSGRLRRSVSAMLGTANFYMPIFEEALEAYQLPLELKYLPVIESALNPNAVSRVGATGLWQFMIGTGKQYGLEVNSLVDERRDPLKASLAAARYLRDLYKIFNDWSLVIAAYNCGPENINKAIHRAGGIKDYWQIYPYLPRETRGYVPAFIAANYIMNYYCEHNICPMVATLPVKTDTVVVTRDVHFEQIAAVLNIETKEIATLNPQYRRNIINGSTKPSVLRLPVKDIITFIDRQDSVFAYRADELLTKRALVAVDDRQLATKGRKNTSRKRGHSGGGKMVTIRKGDNLGAIARRNGTTVAKLRKLNGIKGNNIRAGKKIRVK